MLEFIFSPTRLEARPHREARSVTCGTVAIIPDRMN